MTQKHQISLELIRDINNTINGSGNTVAARRLPSSDILIAFQGALEKQKWEAYSKVLQAFKAGVKFRAREYTVLAYRIQVKSVN